MIFSATPIPGNERSVNETIDRIFEIGAQVVTAADAPIHASGHGWQEELKLMLNLTKPRYVMPFHGDHKRLRLHAELAESVGIDPDRIFRAATASPSRSTPTGARLVRVVPAGMIFVDGVDIGDPDDVALRDRRALSADGVFIVVATISSEDGSQVAPPEIIFRGVPFLDEADGLVDELRDVVERLAFRRGAPRGARAEPAPGGPPRRHRRLRLRAPEAPADDPAGGRRGLGDRAELRRRSCARVTSLALSRAAWRSHPCPVVSGARAAAGSPRALARSCTPPRRRRAGRQSASQTTVTSRAVRPSTATSSASAACRCSAARRS